MNKNFLFPGQGSQYVGMGKLFYEKFDFAKQLYNKANEILEYDIKEISFYDKNSVLNHTINTQPAIYIYSIILDYFLKDNGYEPIAMAGHSLGEYSALVSAEVISFEDGLKLIKERSKKMNNLGSEQPGSMAAIINTDSRTISKLLKKYNNKIVIANYNTPNQTVISGHKQSINNFIENAKKNNIRKIIPLNVSGAFHSPLMKNARIYLEKFIKSTKFNMAKIPIYQNVNPEKNFESDAIKLNTINQLDKPVRWVETIHNMIKDNYIDFIEVGPKNILTNFNKKNACEYNSIATENTNEFNIINA